MGWEWDRVGSNQNLVDTQNKEAALTSHRLRTTARALVNSNR